MDIKEWYTLASEQTGIPREKIEKYFGPAMKESLAKMDTPWEIPDKVTCHYKYSLGGQSRFFKEILLNKQLMGAECPRCDKVWCPPRVNCSHCYGDTRWVTLSGEGSVVTCTTVFFAASGFVRKVPYVVAFIKLDGADTLLFHLIECKDVKEAKPGMRVKVVFKERRLGSISDFYFVPDPSPSPLP